MRFVVAHAPKYRNIHPDRLFQDDRAHIFTPAETQTSQMLAENLLAKFHATEGYQRIAEGLLAIGSSEERVNRSHSDMTANGKETSVQGGAANFTKKLTRLGTLKTALLEQQTTVIVVRSNLIPTRDNL